MLSKHEKLLDVFSKLNYNEKLEKVKKVLEESFNKVSFSYGMSQHISKNYVSETFLNYLYKTVIKIGFDVKGLKEKLFEDLHKKTIDNLKIEAEVSRIEAESILSNL